jgi:ribonuclease P/MRP protein subunit RPP40
VKVDGVLSKARSVVSGVPQGSVLGPLLFLIMIMDIDKDTIDAMMGIFADDTRLWRKSTGDQDIRKLQEELRKTYIWADVNNACFNSDKFEAIRFKKGKKNEQPDPVYFAHNGKEIQFKNHVRDLGVWMSANLTFHEHIRIITSRARQMMGMVLRTFNSRKTEVMLPLLKNLVRSQLEYACPIWSPTDSASIKSLESVQKKFTSKFKRFREYDEQLGMTICTTSYEDRLKTLKLDSLQRRRDRYTIIYICSK